MHVGEKNEETSVHVKKLIDLCLRRVGIFFYGQNFKHLQNGKLNRPLNIFLLLFLFLFCWYPFVGKTRKPQATEIGMKTRACGLSSIGAQKLFHQI